MQSLNEAKEQICEAGRRMYERRFVAANDGNLSIRLNEHEILCTPTLVSKGHMTIDDICTVNLDGEQIGGRRKPSSEIRMHLEVYRNRDDVKSVVHCHPPHVNAFSITGTSIPACIMPEVELFLGEIPTAPYALTGTEQMAKVIRPFVHQTNIIVLAHHGTVSYGETVERATWWTEVLDAYCRTLILSKSLGEPRQLSNEQVRDLLAVKQKWGFEDPRNKSKFENADFRNRPLFGHGE